MSLNLLTETWQGYGDKIGSRHLERLAVIYVRQSTPQQVLDHQESTRLQYGLVRRAIELTLYQQLNHEPQSSYNTLLVSELYDVTSPLWQTVSAAGPCTAK